MVSKMFGASLHDEIKHRCQAYGHCQKIAIARCDKCDAWCCFSCGRHLISEAGKSEWICIHCDPIYFF